MNGKVLLVEDHDGLRQLMGNFLSKSFEVVSAKNGLEAMGWLSKGITPDVILTDADMPEFSGLQLLTNLKCSGMFQHIPVVVFSGSESSEDETMFKQLGAHDFVRKPFNPVQLQDKLRRVSTVRNANPSLATTLSA